MGHIHELGQSRLAKQGVVRAFQIHYLEPDCFSAKVILVSEEDIYLDEFKDEIDTWIIDQLKNIGLVTAKSVLGAPRELLIDKADLEEATVDNVLRILSAEFEEE